MHYRIVFIDMWYVYNFVQVDLLWRRAIGDPGFKRVFCLAHAERLSYQVCDTALRSLQELSQGKQSESVCNYLFGRIRWVYVYIIMYTVFP